MHLLPTQRAKIPERGQNPRNRKSEIQACAPHAPPEMQHGSVAKTPHCNCSVAHCIYARRVAQTPHCHAAFLVPRASPQKCSMAVWQKPHTAIAAWHIAFLPAGWPETHTAMLHFSSSPRPLQSYVFVAFPPSVNCGIVELWNYLLQCPPRNSQSFPTSKLFSWEGLGGGWGQGQCNK